MKYYRAKRNWEEIQEVEIVSETTSFVTLKDGRREAKSTAYGAYYPTREEAKQSILDHLSDKRNALLSQLKNIESRIESAKAL